VLLNSVQELQSYWRSGIVPQTIKGKPVSPVRKMGR